MFQPHRTRVPSNPSFLSLCLCTSSSCRWNAFTPFPSWLTSNSTRFSSGIISARDLPESPLSWAVLLQHVLFPLSLPPPYHYPLDGELQGQGLCLMLLVFTSAGSAHSRSTSTFITDGTHSMCSFSTCQRTMDHYRLGPGLGIENWFSAPALTHIVVYHALSLSLLIR